MRSMLIIFVVPDSSVEKMTLNLPMRNRYLLFCPCSLILKPMTSSRPANQSSLSVMRLESWGTRKSPVAIDFVVTKDRRAGPRMISACGLRPLLPDGCLAAANYRQGSDFEKLLSAGRRAGGCARARDDRGRLWRLWSGPAPGRVGREG